jgi:outer membrane protein OmpA-like peptidoglycan-associated protein
MKTITVIFYLLFFSNGFAQVQKAPLNVLVMDKTRTAIANDKVTFTGRKSGKEFVGITNQRGQFMVHLPAGDVYGIKVDVIGEELDHSTFEVPTPPPGSEFNTVTLEIVYELPTSIVLDDLHFSSGQAVIQSSSYKMLNELSDYLVRKKTMKIRVEGHTDDAGSDASNQELSTKRAKAVRQYLIKKGVSADRISALGFGEVHPIADNTTPQGRALNRRTEIHVIK